MASWVTGPVEEDDPSARLSIMDWGRTASGILWVLAKEASRKDFWALESIKARIGIE